MKRNFLLLFAILFALQSYADCLIINNNNGLQVKTNHLVAINNYRCFTISVFSKLHSNPGTALLLLKYFYEKNVNAQVLTDFNPAAWQKKWASSYLQAFESDMLAQKPLTANEAGNICDSHVLDTTMKISSINVKRYTDSTPVRIDGSTAKFDKTYLVQKEGEAYEFYKAALFCSDCKFSFRKSFRLDLKKGLTGLYSKYIYIPDPIHTLTAEKIIVTSEYYHFQ